ncbi:hypothetical protein ES711_09460 [Gelidibacter salicanalis]|uniref:Uncharacterized protein n=1 Tax=Gelidibacter salicanalis TaxID=291193 RepID=A0A5C7AFX8_9FLAO|nr:hypothetical protein [Gelidibacter salicanalis]TXE07666.1 hypothetical protein ES711_09460 [Gelidibacter salicanalis]
MILKAFREKSIQKYTNGLLNSKTVAVRDNKLESVGVIVDGSEFSNVEAFKTYFNDLGVPLSNIKIIIFAGGNKKTDKLSDNYFSKKDFGWNGCVKRVELQLFIDTPFDALICFYKNEALELKLATAASKANFKIGLSKVDDRLYDFILDVNTDQFEVFKSELKKYLIILNKI